ncbi:MAG TPA: hypothetical protein ENN19_06000 [Chloroflexi bacterium]|nr:hypothetical protein [Chloroflexota bacterium]
MSSIAIQTLVGAALLDHEFCEALLNGERARVLASFDLSDVEEEIALTIEASSIQEFAYQLYEWFTS